MKKNSEDDEFLYRFLVQIVFNPYLKNESTRGKFAKSYLKQKTPALVPENEEKFVGKKINDKSWGSDKIVDYNDAAD